MNNSDAHVLRVAGSDQSSHPSAQTTVNVFERALNDYGQSRNINTLRTSTALYSIISQLQ